MVQYISGMFYISKKTNWAMQLFNLHMICFTMLQGEGGKWQSLLLYYIVHVSTAGLWKVGLSSCHLTGGEEWFVSSIFELGKGAAT